MGKPIKLLLDEHIWEGLAEALAQHSHDVVHLNHTGRRGIDDEPLLAYATAEGRAVLTYNVRHFVPLVRLWYEAGQEHAGVILSVQLPPSELLRQTERLLATLSAAELENTVRWLQEFKGIARRDADRHSLDRSRLRHQATKAGDLIGPGLPG